MEKMCRFEPDEIDLAAVARALRSSLGATIEGALVGRTSAALVIVLCGYSVLETVATRLSRGLVALCKTAGEG
jgi:hypothetical protein